MIATNAAESDIVNMAREACHHCNWTVGECAFEWTRRWAKGRTDVEFSKLLGDVISVDRIGRCRRVWQDFGSLQERYFDLSWSHFDKARSSDLEAESILDWTQENGASVAEMLAFMRSLRGEDLTQPAAAIERPETNASGAELAAMRGPFDETETSQFSEAISGQPSAISQNSEPRTEPARKKVAEPVRECPTGSEINATIKQVEAALQVMQLHWGRFNIAQRDRLELAMSAMWQVLYPSGK